MPRALQLAPPLQPTSHMKNINLVRSAAIFSLIAALGFGCAGAGVQGNSGKDISPSGPTVINQRAVPDSIEIGKDMATPKAPEFLADIKDFNAQVSDVRVRFLHVPLEVPMQNIGGTTWRASLTPRQVQDLAVSGESMRYEANIIATNTDGQTAVSTSPVSITIKAAEVASSG
ncbi:MAG: hypothetical protein A2Z97_05020 [Bdellovibrionales bacterium GWB1_52_6]|nr:MAG: hypothetical protein A2Z97_05020 [Bdellovibrionales bacterium GWB1_52_6]OFZ06380.1 MAG: hypothetical protein A2X97_02870 [Bdellovibrionales bacterium GWA1_52_35]